MQLPKLLIISHMRMGKDTMAGFLGELGFKAKSSSMMAAELFLYDALKDEYGYKSFEECFEDRVNRRTEWHDLICEYNKDDKARLAKSIMADNDIYIGMRSNLEAQECLRQGVFDYIVGVYDPRKPLEPKESFDIDMSMCDFVIWNGSSLESFREKALKLGRMLIDLDKFTSYDHY